MNVYLAFAGGVLLGALMAFLFCVHAVSYWHAKAKAARKPVKPEEKQVETMKKIAWACVLNGFAWIWCSYILAAFDKQQIAESLSAAAVTEIIGVVLAYALKSLVENLSKHNHWPDRKHKEKQADPEPEPELEPEGDGEAAG